MPPIFAPKRFKHNRHIDDEVSEIEVPPSAGSLVGSCTGWRSMLHRLPSHGAVRAVHVWHGHLARPSPAAFCCGAILFGGQGCSSLARQPAAAPSLGVTHRGIGDGFRGRFCRRGRDCRIGPRRLAVVGRVVIGLVRCPLFEHCTGGRAWSTSLDRMREVRRVLPELSVLGVVPCCIHAACSLDMSNLLAVGTTRSGEALQAGHPESRSIRAGAAHP